MLPLDLDPANSILECVATRSTWRKMVSGSRFLAIAPRSARAGRRTISTFFSFAPTRNCSLSLSPNTQKETNKLWNWDVAEVFIGSDFTNIKRYKEFEISPQGEWIDLDIDLSKPHHEEGWTWNSGFEVKARIDQASHTWYGAMRIPWPRSMRVRHSGNTMRINLFRSQGPPSHRKR